MALPGDVWGMIRAAERAGIPWIRLDQPPFRFQRDSSGIRRSGNLLLGQGVNRHIIDGTLCLDREGNKARPFLQDRGSIGRMLAKLGACLPYEAREPPVAHGLLEAIQITERLRYPVVLKPVKRARGEGVTLNVRNIGDLMQAVNLAQSVSQAFVVQRHIKGPTWRIIVSNGKFAGLLRGKPPLDCTGGGGRLHNGVGGKNCPSAAGWLIDDDGGDSGYFKTAGSHRRGRGRPRSGP